MEAKEYKYKFEEHPKPKGNCPSCGHQRTFRFYDGVSQEFGKCERVNECGYHSKPTGEIEVKIKEGPKPPEKEIIYPDPMFCLGLVNNRLSNFHRFGRKTLGIPDDHFEKWKVGTKDNDIETAFVYTDQKGKELNVKFFTYHENGKRNKNKFPYYLSGNEKTRYNKRFYGEHLLSNKPICLVESEKTAVLASYFYPQFDWLATGGNNGVKDHCIDTLYNKKVFYLKDADKAGTENATIKKLISYKINFSIVDLFPGRTDGYDLADAITEGLRPEIKETPKQEVLNTSDSTELDHITDVSKMITESKELENDHLGGADKKVKKPDPLGYTMNLNYEKRFTKAALDLNGSPLMHIGESFSLVALPGGGKSQTMEAISAGFVAKRYNLTCDSLGFSDNVPEGKELLYIDYERPHDINRDGYERIYNRLGCPEHLLDKETGRLPLITHKCFIDVPGVKARKEAFEELVSTGKFGLVLLDGILGLINSMNDEEECNTTIQWLISLASIHEFALVVTMHPNKGSDTMAGHIGAFLYRYSRACLLLKPNENDKNVKQITREFSQGKLSYALDVESYFRYSDEHRMFVSELEAPAAQPRASVINRGTFEGIFNEYLLKGQSSIVVGDIKKRYHEITGKSLETAKKHLEAAVELGILIYDSGNGKASKYKLSQE